MVSVNLRHDEGHIRYHSECARVRDHSTSRSSKLRLQLPGNVSVERSKDDLREFDRGSFGDVRLQRHRRYSGGQWSVQLPPARLSVRLTRAAIARCKPCNLKPRMIAQQLNESLPDHAGRAKNANPAS